MKFEDIENIWTVEMADLSNRDKAIVYYERARHVVDRALADPKERQKAVEGSRFRRTYLVEQICSQPAVATQNPRIRRLLEQADKELARAQSAEAPRRAPAVWAADAASPTADERLALLAASRHREEQLRAEVAALRREPGERSA